MTNTSAFIEKLLAYLNTVKNGVCFYYDRAPDDGTYPDGDRDKKTYPYGVVSGITATDLGEGDLTFFDVELWGDEKKQAAAEDIESLCDDLRNALHNRIISYDGVFSAHVGYEGRDTSSDREDDLLHRRLFFAARIFYL